MAVTLVAVPCCQLSYMSYVYRFCDLLVLKIKRSYQLHNRKLSIKKESFKYCLSTGLLMKVLQYLILTFFIDQTNVGQILSLEYSFFYLK